MSEKSTEFSIERTYSARAMETKYDTRVLRKDGILASWGKKYPEGSEKLCKEGSEQRRLALPKGLSG